MILDDVPREVPPDKAQMRTGFERHWPNKEIAQGGVGPAMLAEGQFDEGGIAHRSAQKIEEAFAGGSHAG